MDKSKPDVLKRQNSLSDTLIAIQGKYLRVTEQPNTDGSRRLSIAEMVSTPNDELQFNQRNVVVHNPEIARQLADILKKYIAANTVDVIDEIFGDGGETQVIDIKKGSSFAKPPKKDDDDEVKPDVAGEIDIDIDIDEAAGKIEDVKPDKSGLDTDKSADALEKGGGKPLDFKPKSSGADDIDQDLDEVEQELEELEEGEIAEEIANIEAEAAQELELEKAAAAEAKKKKEETASPPPTGESSAVTEDGQTDMEEFTPEGEELPEGYIQIMPKFKKVTPEIYRVMVAIDEFENKEEPPPVTYVQEQLAEVWESDVVAYYIDDAIKHGYIEYADKAHDYLDLTDDGIEYFDKRDEKLEGVEPGEPLLKLDFRILEIYKDDSANYQKTGNGATSIKVHNILNDKKKKPNAETVTKDRIIASLATLEERELVARIPNAPGAVQYYLTDKGLELVK